MEINDFSHSSFDDIVFEGRNKGYGAYQLRKLQARDVFFALLLGSFILSAIVFGPLVWSKYFNKNNGPKVTEEVAVELTLANLPPPAKEESVVKPQEPVKVEMEKNVRYQPTLDTEVQDEEPLPDSLLLFTNSGPVSQEGDSS